MEIISSNFLDTLFVSSLEQQQIKQKRNRIVEAQQTGRVTVFLSHSHSDKKRIEAVVKIFNSVGIDIYVDWLDNEMQMVTNGRTADLIKTKIKSNKKFILFASNIAIKSNWVNWELGIGDGAKYIDNMMIFPFREGNQNWTNNEYFEIYPHLEAESQYDSETQRNVTFYVVYPNKSKYKLQDWLKR